MNLLIAGLVGIVPKIIFSILLIVLLVLVVKSLYKKAPPDTAYIISGRTKEPRTLVGRGGFVIPIIEQIDKLNLKLIPLDIKTKDSVPTADCINIFVDSAVNVKVKNDAKFINIAAQNFLNKQPEEIGRIVAEVL